MCSPVFPTSAFPLVVVEISLTDKKNAVDENTNIPISRSRICRYEELLSPPKHPHVISSPLSIDISMSPINVQVSVIISSRDISLVLGYMTKMPKIISREGNVYVTNIAGREFIILYDSIAS